MASDKKRKWRRLFFWLGIVLLFFAGSAALFWFTLPDVSWLKSQNPTETALMTFRQQEARRQGETSRRIWHWVRLGRMSPYLIQAVLIAEDDKFFEHEGFDWEAMKKALEANIEKKRIIRGGSTLSQQLAKNLFLSPHQSLLRKIREAAITIKIEKELNKKRILELYLNVIEWGDGIYGAEAAARVFFHKSAANLDLAEAIRLASVLPNPHRFSPLGSASRRMNRKRRIIAERMRQRGWMADDTFEKIMEELGLNPQ